MCGSDEPHPCPVRSFTYLIEQIRANEVKKGDNVKYFRSQIFLPIARLEIPSMASID